MFLAFQDNLDAPLDKLKDAAGGWTGELLTWGLIGVIAILVLYIVIKIVAGRRRPGRLPEPDLSIDINALPAVAPPPGTTGLFFFNVPVRLAAVVLAPAGRVRELPPPGRLHELFDSIYPGLSVLVDSHQPLIRRWPPQLSVRGFAQQFFTNVKLPGQGGKGSPWCSAAGVCRFEGQPVMIGIVFRAAASTNLGQQIIEEEAQWMGMIQVRG
jgi:hypothetical protein